MTWYKVTLSDDAKRMALRQAFETALASHGSPADAGMFAASAAVSHVLFFSPGGARIAKSLIEFYAGAECSAPTRSEVSVLLAHDNLSAIPFAAER